jgi:hypothetical protein
MKRRSNCARSLARSDLVRWGKVDIRKPTLRTPYPRSPGAGLGWSLAAEELKWMIIEAARLLGISVSVKA